MEWRNLNFSGRAFGTERGEGHLSLTGHITSVRFSFAFFGVNAL
jgi:hypothetical protein